MVGAERRRHLYAATMPSVKPRRNVLGRVGWKDALVTGVVEAGGWNRSGTVEAGGVVGLLGASEDR